MSRAPLAHRQANARLRVLNPDGTPAVRREVSVDQVSHQFLFGCGAFDAVELMKTQDEKKQAFLRERMEKWLALFNYGTLPFYWGGFDGEEGKPNTEVLKKAAEFLKSKGLNARSDKAEKRPSYRRDRYRKVQRPQTTGKVHRRQKSCRIHVRL